MATTAQMAVRVWAALAMPTFPERGWALRSPLGTGTVVATVSVDIGRVIADTIYQHPRANSREHARHVLNALGAAGYVLVKVDALPEPYSPTKYYLSPDPDEPSVWLGTDEPLSPWVCVDPQDEESMRAAGFVRAGWADPDGNVWTSAQLATMDSRLFRFRRDRPVWLAPEDDGDG